MNRVETAAATRYTLGIMRWIFSVGWCVGFVGVVAALDVSPDPFDAGEVIRGGRATGRVTISNPSGSARNVDLVAPDGCSVDPESVTVEAGAAAEIAMSCLANRPPGPARWRFAVIADGNGPVPPPLTMRAEVVPAARLIPEGPIDLGNAGGRTWHVRRVLRLAALPEAGSPRIEDPETHRAEGLQLALETAVEADSLADGTAIEPGDRVLTVRSDPLPPGDHVRAVRVATGVDADPHLDVAVEIHVLPLLRGDSFEWSVPEPGPDGAAVAEYVVTPRTGVSAAEVEVAVSPEPLRVLTSVDRRRLRVRIEIPPDPDELPARAEIRFEWGGEIQVVEVTVGGDPPPSPPRSRTTRKRR